MYQVEDSELAAVLAVLHVREQQGYELVELDVDVGGGERVRAVAWIATAENPYFSGGESIEEIAAIVARSHGPSGANVEYVRELERALLDLGAPDDHVSAVARLLAGSDPITRAAG